MSTTPPSPRRVAIAGIAAVASTTIAVGVTAASLLGWFRPAAAPPEEPPPAAPAQASPSPVIFVPVAPAAPPAAPGPAPGDDAAGATFQLAVHDRERGHDDDDDRGRDRHDRDHRGGHHGEDDDD